MIKKIKSRKAQEEIVGFVIIILLVAIIALIFLGIGLRKGLSKDAENSAKLDNFLESAMGYTSDCTKTFEQDYLDVSKLIKGCYKKEYCEDEKGMCNVLNATLGGMIDSVFKVSDNRPTSYYHLNIYYLSNISDDSSIETIYELEKGECRGGKLGAEEIISALPGNINVQLEICERS